MRFISEAYFEGKFPESHYDDIIDIDSVDENSKSSILYHVLQSDDITKLEVKIASHAQGKLLHISTEYSYTFSF